MPIVTRNGSSIYYEESGAGEPVLLLAPGGIRSRIARWDGYLINPLESFGDDFHFVSMDQRNNGQSVATFEDADPWNAYADDQFAVMDHLGIDSFSVLGACIGCSFALKLIERAPHRIRSAALVQPIGVIGNDFGFWRTSCAKWIDEVLGDRAAEKTAAKDFCDQMWNRDFVVSVTRDEVKKVQTPLLVLPGINDVHPTVVGRDIATLAANAELIDPWQDTPEDIEQATQAVREFLKEHASA